tara:strand:+ start:3552 stop:4046 length:495 start_codon:yes stop_codon:yes gene_type:complete
MSSQICRYNYNMDIENFKPQLPSGNTEIVMEESVTPLPASGGRPSKLTPKVLEDIVKWLKLGYYQEDAAVMAGISKSTFYGWLKKAEDGDSRFLEFSDAVKKARAESEGAHIMNIRKAADNGVWQASAWFLERSYPGKWGKKNPDLISEDSDEPVEFVIKYADG